MPLHTKADHPVVGEGKVIAVVPGSRQIVIDHQRDTRLAMGAMTMGYKLTPVPS